MFLIQYQVKEVPLQGGIPNTAVWQNWNATDNDKLISIIDIQYFISAMLQYQKFLDKISKS